ncbi:hypothetical protein RHMOL_Rhmol09G0215700 [Rhododendron molle]|uniref:Uncharacterized protein n=1 Tax=Rhododendron molle TaxID=49168 RepID=A0ACC0MH03_RHOML|nr:hypothetical protein RHMOL_Rhmol09G0215700 [Rhododendron molle]
MDYCLPIAVTCQQNSLNLPLSLNIDLPNAKAANVLEIVVPAVPTRVPWCSIVGRVVEYEVRLYERGRAQNNLNQLQAELQELQANPPTLSGQILIFNAQFEIQQAQQTLQEAITTCYNLKRQIIRFMRNLIFLRPIILTSTNSVRALRRARDWLGPQYGRLRYRLNNAHARVYEDVQLVCRQYQISIPANQPHDQNRIDTVLPVNPTSEDALVDGQPVV